MRMFPLISHCAGILLILLFSLLSVFSFPATDTTTANASVDVSQPGAPSPVHPYDVEGENLNLSLRHDGQKRSYLLHVPQNVYPGERTPLIVVLHNRGGTAKRMMRITEGQFNLKADREGYLVVYPEAIDRQWNLGWHTQGASNRKGIDDVGFVETLISTLQSSYQIDTERIFIVGMSHGGMMAFRLACAMPGTFRAIATVTATLPENMLPMCAENQGTSLLMINGTDDPIVPYEGGAMEMGRRITANVLSTEETVAHWLETSNCPSHAEKDVLPDINNKDGTTVNRYSYTGCSSDVRVRLYEIEGGGHTWPGGKQQRRESRIGRASKEIDACEQIWSFFGQFAALR